LAQGCDRHSAVARKLAEGAEIAAVAVGAHGWDDAVECATFHAALADHAACPVMVVNDAELLPAALGYEHQIGLVAGTGSIAVCRDRKHGMMVAGGWGWVIGDEGSAAGLMREAARAVSLHLDGGGALSEPLAALLLQGLAIPNAARLGSTIAGLGGSAELGRHASLVFDAEASGSLLARQVICDGAVVMSWLPVTLLGEALVSLHHDHAAIGHRVLHLPTDAGDIPPALDDFRSIIGCGVGNLHVNLRAFGADCDRQHQGQSE
jgi:N-acetylglucosamine kinase-like BadF-type ATPase